MADLRGNADQPCQHDDEDNTCVNAIHAILCLFMIAPDHSLLDVSSVAVALSVVSVDSPAAALFRLSRSCCCNARLASVSTGRVVAS